MAQGTLLQMATDETIEALREDPARVADLPAPAGGGGSFLTYYLCSLNYFITGAAYPSNHALGGVLLGLEHHATDALNAGTFGCVPAVSAKDLARLLAELDLSQIEDAVGSADFDDLLDQDVDDADALAAEPDPAKEVGDSLRRLAAFYAEAARRDLGVVMFTE